MKTYYFAVIVATLAVASACRKKEAPSSPLSLSTPDKAFPSTGGSNAPSYIKPEAEATASKGPIQLTFRLYKKTVKAKVPDFDTSIWGQIELKNVGKNKFLIQDEIFYKPGPIEDASETQSGIYIEIFDSRGKAVKIYRPLKFDDIAKVNPNPHPTPAEAEHTKAVDSMVAGWRRQGLSSREIDAKLLDYFRSQPNREEQEKWNRRFADPHSELLPGQSTTSVAWAYSPDIPLGAPRIEPKPIGQFTELASYALKPGHYRIHAVYNCALTERLKKMKEIFPPDETDVRVGTPFIQFEVVQ